MTNNDIDEVEPLVNPDPASLIDAIGNDNSINCLIRCSRLNYGVIASLRRSFRSLIRSGDIYKWRHQNGVVEHWLFFSCQWLQWHVFDPINCRWMHLPIMNPHECFVFSHIESLAVGTQLLVFGKDVLSHVVYHYSLLTNTWSSGMRINAPRSFFASASLGNIAILAGGFDSQGNILSKAELFDSEGAGTWKSLPSMNKPRKMCSGVFMDGKFYVIGGIGEYESKLLTCGEEYDLKSRTWTEIPNMSPCADRYYTSRAPPFVAVVNNELYAADCADMKVRKYDKKNKTWVSIGQLPTFMNCWGFGFRVCGDKLLVIGGSMDIGAEYIEVNSCDPSKGEIRWNLLGRQQSASKFVYSCAVMGCCSILYLSLSLMLYFTFMFLRCLQSLFL